MEAAGVSVLGLVRELTRRNTALGTTTMKDTFLIFYAVAYGAVFGISDRLRPFMLIRGSREGRRRNLLAVVMLVAIPVGYLTLALPIVGSAHGSSSVCIGASVYEVAPLPLLYWIWSWFVLTMHTYFYSDEEKVVHPIRAAFDFYHGDPQLPAVGMLFHTLLFGVGPAIVLFAIASGQACH